MTPTISDIILATVDASRYSREELVGERRFADLAHWRACAMFIALDQTGRSTTQVGRAFRRDHTTVIYARRRIEADTDQRTQERLQAIRTRLAMRLSAHPSTEGVAA